jgi:exodeoxyribonuclease VII large subunit
MKQWVRPEALRFDFDAPDEPPGKQVAEPAAGELPVPFGPRPQPVAVEPPARDGSERPERSEPSERPARPERDRRGDGGAAAGGRPRRGEPEGAVAADRDVETTAPRLEGEGEVASGETATAADRRPARPRSAAQPGADGALTIAQFYDRVRAALSRALPGEVWVTGEIRSAKESKGHRFLELADHDETGGAGPAQQLEVVCWARDWSRIGRELSRAGVSLEAGRVVRVRGKVSVWEGGGRLRLQMTALDVEALLGGIAVARQRLLRQLGAEGLVQANRSLVLSPVPLRVGVVTSERSEAHRDFAGRLEQSGFAFEVRVEQSLVQGAQAPWQIAAALRRLARADLDLVVVVRGGGGRGDLAAFDSEPVARAIAGAPVPVWVGIGHTGDRSVADEVAHSSFVTPTACGDAVVARVQAYWSGVLRAAATLAARTSSGLAAASNELARSRTFLSHELTHQLARRADELGARRGRLDGAASRLLGSEAARLASAAGSLARCGRAGALEEAHHVRRCRDVLRAYDPQRQLERGWSLTRDGSGRIVRSVEQLATGVLVRTAVADGELSARVEQLVRQGEGAAAAGAILPYAGSPACTPSRER